MTYNGWYTHAVLRLVECPACGNHIEIIAVDSIGHEIVPPCYICRNDWKAEQILKSQTEKTKICDECGGKLRVRKDKSKRCIKCGEVYLV